MGIYYNGLESALRAFETDNILSITEKTSETPKAENIPCHLVIAQGDNPNTSATLGAATLPILIYAKVYTGLGVVINVDDVLVVQKKDKKGNVLATYHGKAGVPTVRQSRKETALQITKVVQEFSIDDEPTVPDTPVCNDCVAVGMRLSDGEGGFYWDESASATVLPREAKVNDGEGGLMTAYFVDFHHNWEITETGVYYLDGNGTLNQVKKGSKLRIVETGEICTLSAAPYLKEDDTTWTAQVTWS